MKRKETAEIRKGKRDRRTEKERNERDQKKGITRRKMTEARAPAGTWEGEDKERTGLRKERGECESLVPFVVQTLVNFSLKN